jgi:hypothetical protein
LEGMSLTGPNCRFRPLRRNTGKNPQQAIYCVVRGYFAYVIELLL